MAIYFIQYVKECKGKIEKKMRFGQLPSGTFVLTKFFQKNEKSPIRPNGLMGNKGGYF